MRLADLAGRLVADVATKPLIQGGDYRSALDELVGRVVG